MAKMERVHNHPGIYKRGTRYVVVWRDAMGDQRKTFCRTLAEAREEQGRRRRMDDRHPESRDRFDHYAADWLDTYRGRTGRALSDTTKRDYRRSIEHWAVPYFGRKRLAAIGARDVVSFVAHMEVKGCRTPTVRKNLVPLKAMFATAVQFGDMRVNPTVGVRLTAPQEVGVKAKALTREELRVVLVAVPEEWQPFFTFLAQTGLRISEALGVTWADLDLGQKPHVHVHQQCYKGSVKKLKTGYSVRDVPLTQGMVATLLAHRARSFQGEHAPVWSSTVGTHLSSHNVRKRILKPAVEGTGLDWVGFHTFRHTCASLLFDAGKNVTQVARWLGHSDPAFTLRTYVHLVDDGVGTADFLDDAVRSAI